MSPAEADRMRHRLLRLRNRLAELDPVVAGAVDVSDGALDEPLRVAVVGLVKAGKSTLVNALVGRRVAPTDEAECTRIVTWYRYGGPERAELHLLDGTAIELPRTAGEQLLPDDLPVPVDRVSHAVVHVQEAALHDFTLIDTPGLGSTTAEYSDATRRAVLQTTQADALVYVVRDRALSDDAAFMQEFTASAGARGASATDTVGVLSHADAFGDGPWGREDPVEAAGRAALRSADRRRAELGTVIPFAGLLAESTSTGRIGDGDVALLRDLRTVDDDDLQDGEGLPSGVEWHGVEDLARRVGWYGVARGRAAAASGPAALLAWAEAASGRDRLEQELRARYIGRHRQLRAAQILLAFELAADPSPHRSALVDEVLEVRRDPAMLPLRQLDAWEALRSSDPRSELLAELERTIDAEDDRAALGLPRAAAAADVATAAAERSSAAHTAVLFSTTTAEQVAARTLEVYYQRIAARWSEGG